MRFQHRAGNRRENACGDREVRIEVEASQDRGIEIPHAFRLNADRIEVVGEKGAGRASITQEFQADREGRRQADALPLCLTPPM